MGRPKGSKNKNPKNTSKIEGKEVEIEEGVGDSNKELLAGLSEEKKALYAGFFKRHKLPLDDLKQLAESMKGRYNIGLRTEIKEHETKVKLAKEELIDIEESGMIGGYKESIMRVNARKRKLTKIITGKYIISSSLTTLSAELKNVFVEIERIEAGQPKGNVNIFHLLQGGGDKEKVDALEIELFTPDKELREQMEKDKENDN